MAIVNYPERIFKTTLPAIDVVMGRNKTYNYQYSQDITAAAIDEMVSADRNWKVNSIVFSFSGATVRNFAFAIANGRKVVENYNDFLWFQLNTSVWQKIVLTPGFYTGTQLAAHLKAVMDANTDFAALGVTFTVTYSNTTGLFVITPSAGTIRYLNRNLSQVLGLRDSIGANLLGLSADTSFGANVTSDTACAGLDNDSSVYSAVGSAVLTYNYITPISLSIDQAIHVTTNTAAVTVAVDVNYQIEQ